MKRLRGVLYPLKILLYLFIVVFSLYIIGSIFLPDITMNVIRFKHFIIASDSMQPHIMRGDIIIVNKTNYSSLQEGDIITFYVDTNLNQSKEVVTHYIHSISLNENDAREYRTNRAGSSIPDSWTITDKDIIGKQVSIIPRIGNMFLFFQSSIGGLVLLNSTLILIMIIYLLSNKPVEKKQLINNIHITKVEQ